MENLQEKFDALISQSIKIYADNKLQAGLKYYEAISLISKAPDKYEIIKKNNITKHIVHTLDLDNPEKAMAYSIMGIVSKMLRDAENNLGEALKESSKENLSRGPSFGNMYTEGTPIGF
jgi:hypothetical protein